METRWSECFNSLQTGKSFRTGLMLFGRKQRQKKVSIPFKRESPFGLRHCKVLYMAKANLRFNSLQTGKSFRTHEKSYRKVHCVHQEFQFPSNGKVLSDIIMKRLLTSSDSSCFNSLQTGKSFRTWEKRETCFGRQVLFQFPSNGKVLSDLWRS